MNIVKKLAVAMLVLPVFLVGGTAIAEEKTPSGSITIDETQVMWIVGGDIGGGTLEFQGKSYAFKTHGLKLGGFGVHKVKLTGDAMTSIRLQTSRVFMPSRKRVPHWVMPARVIT